MANFKRIHREEGTEDKMNAKRAIVTGASGFLGNYLVGELLTENYEVWAVFKGDEDISGLTWIQRAHTLSCELNSISDLPLLIEERGFDCFFHLAWAGSFGTARGNYELQMQNAAAAGNAASAAAELGCKRFVGAGSVTELMYGPYFQTDGSKPEMVACYAIGKIAAEYICRSVCTAKNIDYIWPYISNFYGVGDRTNNFVNFLSQSYLRGTTPALTSGDQLADFMYVTDVAYALRMLGEAGKAGSCYYVGYGHPRPLKQYILAIRDAVDPTIEAGLGRKEFHGLNIDFSKIDIGKLGRDTGFAARIPFEQGIVKTIEWNKERIHND